MEAEATYTAARPVVAAPAWRASAERPDFPAGAEGRFTRGKVKAPLPTESVLLPIARLILRVENYGWPMTGQPSISYPTLAPLASTPQRGFLARNRLA